MIYFLIKRQRCLLLFPSVTAELQHTSDTSQASVYFSETVQRYKPNLVTHSRSSPAGG